LTTVDRRQRQQCRQAQQDSPPGVLYIKSLGIDMTDHFFKGCHRQPELVVNALSII
jgi:hypothetical protein